MVWGFMVKSGQNTTSSHLTVQNAPLISRLRFAIFRGSGATCICWARRLPDLVNAVRRFVEIAPGQATGVTPTLVAIHSKGVCSDFSSESLSPDTRLRLFIKN